MWTRPLLCAALVPALILPAWAGGDLDQASDHVLTAYAAGAPDDPRTREAAFLLAERRVETAGESGSARRRAVDAIVSATGRFPDDPRVHGLVLTQVELHHAAGDPYAAHAVTRKIIDAVDDPAWVARAAVTATIARDFETAWEWSQRVDPETVDGSARVDLLKARLKSGAAVTRTDDALRAARRLLDEAPEALHVDAEALLASGRLFESVGLLEDAIALYDRFVNVHLRHDDRAETMLTLGRLQARAGFLARAYRTFVWLEDTYPASPFSHESRLERIVLEGVAADPEGVPAYVDAIVRAPDLRRGRETCVVLVERLVGAGHPHAAARAAIDLARTADDRGIAPLAARECVSETAGLISDLLTVRGDDVGVVAFGREIEDLDLLLDEPTRDRVVASRKRLGLAAVSEGPLEHATTEARRRLTAGDDPATVATELEGVLFIEFDAHPHSKIEARLALAEALWRAGRTEAALTTTRTALTSRPDASQERALRVLLADVLFADGRRDEACVEYKAAGKAAPSPWVDDQVERCTEQPS